MFQIVYTPVFWESIEKLKKDNIKAGFKVINFIKEFTEHPETGTGNPEKLKYNLKDCWSRRITKKHRLIYQIKGRTVILISAFGHYNDK